MPFLLKVLFFFTVAAVKMMRWDRSGAHENCDEAIHYDYNEETILSGKKHVS